MRAGILAIFGVLLFAGEVARSATITVNSTNDPAGFNAAITVGGLGATVTLRDAVNAANNTPGDDTIVFDASLNGATVSLGQSAITWSALVVTSTVSISAVGGAPVVIERATSATHRLFAVINGGSLALTNVTIANGLVLSAQYGGGLYNSGTLRLDRCTIRDCSTGSPTAGGGGGIYNSGLLVVQDTTIRNCLTSWGGGGMWNVGTASFAGCTLMSNQMTTVNVQYGGGAILSWGGSLSLTNCTVANNTDAYVNGGMYVIGVGSVFRLVSCTIAGNSGFAINTAFGPEVYARNSIITYGGFNFTSDSSNNFNAATALLGPPAPNGGPTYTCALTPSSALVGKGVADPTVTTDQRGTARNNPPDPGAYEMDPRATLEVSTTLDEDNGSTHPALGTGTSLREALALATTLGGTQIVSFSRSLTNSGPATITLTNEVVVAGVNVAINGLGASALKISGNNACRVLRVATGATASVSGLMLANGRVDHADPVLGSGGGVHNAGTLSLTDCVLTGNVSGVTQTGHGGAIYSHGPSLTLLRTTLSGNRTIAGGNGGGLNIDAGTGSILSSIISGNTARNYGGGICSWTANLMVSDSSISGNSAVNGGGLYHRYGSACDIARCTFSGNMAGGGGYGGGLWAEQGTVSIDASTFSYNAATNGNGGGIANLGSTMGLTNCTFAYNSADNGGGLIHYGAPLKLVHCSVLYNSAVYTGGGIERVGRVGNTFSLLNTLVGGNNAPAGPDAYSYADTNDGTFSTLGNNLIGDGSGLLGLTNGVNSDLVNVPPHTLALQNNGGPTETIAFSPYAAAINGAAVVPGLGVDQRGSSRSVGVAPDIGAYEDGTGNGDYDGDSLSNAQEGILGTFSFTIDTDGDGYNDATESMGGNPLTAGQIPPATHVERVLGYGAARGLDLSGTFLYAFNVGTPAVSGTAGDATFTSDTAPGITLVAPNEIPNWITPSFGNSAEDDLLESIYSSIRWADYPNTLTVDLTGTMPLRKYKLQLLFGEGGYAARVFDVFFGGSLIVDNFRPYVAQGSTAPGYAVSAIVHEFIATGTTVSIVLDGENVPLDPGVDRNPILNGVTLEVLPNMVSTNPVRTMSLRFEETLVGRFTNQPNGLFTVYATTNIATPRNLWENLGTPYESSPGNFEFYDENAEDYRQRFYQIRSP